MVQDVWKEDWVEAIPAERAPPFELTTELVEAAGVEPASENAVSKETTYLVAFTHRLPGSLASRAENGQETRPASLKVSPRTPDVGFEASSLYDALTPAHEQSRRERQLN
jgi:hypothetical protein